MSGKFGGELSDGWFIGDDDESKLGMAGPRILADEIFGPG
jgi:hypothetical protein